MDKDELFKEWLEEKFESVHAAIETVAATVQEMKKVCEARRIFCLGEMRSFDDRIDTLEQKNSWRNGLAAAENQHETRKWNARTVMSQAIPPLIAGAVGAVVAILVAGVI